MDSPPTYLVTFPSRRQVVVPCFVSSVIVPQPPSDCIRLCSVQRLDLLFRRRKARLPLWRIQVRPTTSAFLQKLWTRAAELLRAMGCPCGHPDIVEGIIRWLGHVRQLMRHPRRRFAGSHPQWRRSSHSYRASSPPEQIQRPPTLFAKTLPPQNTVLRFPKLLAIATSDSRRGAPLSGQRNATCCGVHAPRPLLVFPVPRWEADMIAMAQDNRDV